MQHDLAAGKGALETRKLARQQALARFRAWCYATNLFPRIAVAVWIIITIVVAIRLPRYADKPDSIPHLLYQAGQHFRDNLPLYEQEGAYRYSPGVAAVLSLLARLPYHLAAFIGLAASLAGFFAGLDRKSVV